jgi:acetyl esterase
MASVIEVVVPARGGAPAVPTRLYRPRPGPAPLVVFAHGGGWTIGGLDTHDRICRRLAHTSGAAVLSVDYRLAPEHPAPAAVEDVVSVLEWVAAEPPELAPASRPVAVAGDSAGGTVAALACLRLRDTGSAALPELQVLVYANTDLTGPGASMREKASGWGLDVSGIEFFNRQWVPDAGRWADPAVSPLRVPDLRGLPPAIIVTAEHDPYATRGRPTPTGCTRPASPCSCGVRTGWCTTSSCTTRLLRPAPKPRTGSPATSAARWASETARTPRRSR